MTVRELINKLLDRPMDDEVMLCYYKEHVDKYGEKCSGYCFGIDDVKKVKSYSQIGEMRKKAMTESEKRSYNKGIASVWKAIAKVTPRSGDYTLLYNAVQGMEKYPNGFKVKIDLIGESEGE